MKLRVKEDLRAPVLCNPTRTRLSARHRFQEADSVFMFIIDEYPNRTIQQFLGANIIKN
ncbi:MAG: hypothetical protein RR280_06255 [Bacteroidaceae bacterium]